MNKTVKVAEWDRENAILIHALLYLPVNHIPCGIDASRDIYCSFGDKHSWSSCNLNDFLFRLKKSIKWPITNCSPRNLPVSKFSLWLHKSTTWPVYSPNLRCMHTSSYWIAWLDEIQMYLPHLMVSVNCCEGTGNKIPSPRINVKFGRKFVQNTSCTDGYTDQNGYSDSH